MSNLRQMYLNDDDNFVDILDTLLSSWDNVFPLYLSVVKYDLQYTFECLLTEFSFL